MEPRELEIAPSKYFEGPLAALRRNALIMLVIGAVLMAVGFSQDRLHALAGYLVGYLFWGGVGIGSLGFLMLHHTVGGGWGFVLRRFLEAGAKTLPVVAVLAAPMLFSLWGVGGLPQMFEWATAAGAEDHLIQEKAPWLNPGAFTIRTVIYFIILLGFSFRIQSRAKVYDQPGDHQRAFHSLNNIGGLGILCYVLVVTFFAVDYVLSLTPKWNSSIIGLLFTGAFALGTMALYLVLLGSFGAGKLAPLNRLTHIYRDLGNLTLAMVMLWAYMSFSQYLITFSGNTAEEAPWYLSRWAGVWQVWSLVLVVVHFFVPFFVLLTGSRIKKDPSKLKGIALWIVVMRFVDLHWWVMPVFFSRDYTFNAADVGGPLLVGGIWLLVWGAEYAKSPSLAPVHDPRLVDGLGSLPGAEVLSHG